jgi:hypothetical protein
MKTSRGTTRKMQQQDNRDEGAQTIHQNQQGQPNNDQKRSSGNHPTHAEKATAEQHTQRS